MRSFDVFDTVLTRAVGAPEAVFDIVGRQLADVLGVPVETGPFVEARRRVPERLIDAHQREATLEEVYAEVAVALGLPSSAAGRMLELELQCERALSRLVPGACEAVAAARASGPVVFLSDTPMPGWFVQELLTRAGVWDEDDRLYCSSEHGVSKSRGGGLFDVAAADLGVPTPCMHHTGDNPYSDVAEARTRGVVASEAPAGRLNRYEWILEREATASGGVSSYLAGASRLARMRATGEGIDPVLAAGAAGVAAPLLVGFAVWLVRQAEEHDLRHLYFVSRDAEVMLRVFTPVAAAMGSDVQAHYLYGSRAAWELTSLHDASADDVRDRLLGHRGDSLADATHRLGLTPEDVRGLVDGLTVDPSRTDPLSDRTLERLAAAAGREPLLSRIRAVATERRELMLDYLTQEGLATRGPVSGLVDVGWMGRTFQALDTAMEQAGLPAVHSYFYVGRSVFAPRWTSPQLAARQRAWLFDQMRPSGRPAQPSGIEAAIEALCTGTEGSLRAYERQDGRVVPVLVAPVNRAPVDWGLLDLRRTVDLVVEELTKAGAPLERRGDLRGASDGALRQLWLRPTPAEVDLWGRFPTDEADDHQGMRSLAVQVQTADVAAQLRAGHLKIRPIFSWRAGTAKISPSPWRQILSAMIWYDEHKAGLRSLPRRVRLRLARRAR